MLYVTLTGRMPFASEPGSIVRFFERIRRAACDYPDTLSAAARDLLERHLLVLDASRRATMAAVLRHPWFDEATIGLGG